MKQDTISKTYRIKIVSVKKIENFAKNQSISQSKAMDTLINMATHWLEEKQLEKELDEMSNNEKWMQKNLDWSEINLN